MKNLLVLERILGKCIHGTVSLDYQKKTLEVCWERILGKYMHRTVSFDLSKEKRLSLIRIFESKIRSRQPLHRMFTSRETSCPGWGSQVEDQRQLYKFKRIRVSQSSPNHLDLALSPEQTILCCRFPSSDSGGIDLQVARATGLDNAEWYVVAQWIIECWVRCWNPVIVEGYIFSGAGMHQRHSGH